MTATMTIEVFGVKEALKELNDIDPDLRKQINAKAKDIVKPAVDAIKNKYPSEYLSGMQRPAAAIIDMAGKQGGRSLQGGRFVDSLTAMFGQPSRVMWPGYLTQGNEVEQRMFNLVKDLMQSVNKNLVM